MYLCQNYMPILIFLNECIYIYIRFYRNCVISYDKLRKQFAKNVKSSKTKAFYARRLSVHVSNFGWCQKAVTYTNRTEPMLW